MVRTDHSPPPTPSAATTSVGIDHVRLSYPYLDSGNLDAYASLLHHDVQLKRPDLPEAHGRDEVLKLLAAVAGPPGQHQLYKVLGDGDCVVATGRTTGRHGPRCPQTILDVDFADFITLSDEGLLLGIRRFYYYAPMTCDCDFP